MQLYHRSLLSGLAVVALMMTFTSTGLVKAKPPSCCTEVSSKEVVAPILNYTFQKAKLPCVNAVVFETADGVMCSAPGAPWVREAIRKVRLAKQKS